MSFFTLSHLHVSSHYPQFRMDTDHPWMPVVGQLRMRTVFLQSHTDTKISTSTHLCEWRLSMEIKWHYRKYHC